MFLDRMRAEALERGDMDGVEYLILAGLDLPPECGMRIGFNGYAHFPNRPIKEPGTGGIVGCVRVHGGITFAQETPDGGVVYGFDTAHLRSELYPIRDRLWIRLQIAHMIAGLRKAAELEELWRQGDADSRATVDAALDELADGTGDDCDLIGRVVRAMQDAALRAEESGDEERAPGAERNERADQDRDREDRNRDVQDFVKGFRQPEVAGEPPKQPKDQAADDDVKREARGGGE